MPAGDNWLRLGVAAVWAVGIANAAALWLAATPDNVLKRGAEPLLRPYRALHVAHDWKLFAPNPVSTNYTVYLRAKTRTGRIGPWVDVSTPLLKALQRNRFSETQPVYEALSHASSACARQWHRSLSRCDGSSNTMPERVMVRTAYAEYAALADTAGVSAIQVVLLRSSYPRFGEARGDLLTIQPADHGPWLAAPAVAHVRS